VCYDLLEACEEKRLEDTVLLKLEQIYPFPKESSSQGIAKVSQRHRYRLGSGGAAEHGRVVLREREIAAELKGPQALRYVGRQESASTATGALKVHQKEQAALIKAAISPAGIKKN
jgi:2-oxoglutarate dehydrogenase E1 component